MSTAALREYLNENVRKIIKSAQRNKYYHSKLRSLVQFNIPPGAKVLDIGCGTGDLLASVHPAFGVGIDFSKEILKEARIRHPGLKFVCYDMDVLSLRGTFEYILISNVLDFAYDIQELFAFLRRVSGPKTKIVILHYNYLWLPIIRIGELIGLKFRIRKIRRNWISMEDILNFFELCDIECIRRNFYLLAPVYIPVLSNFLNRYVAKFPLVRRFDMTTFLVGRFKPSYSAPSKEYSVSVIIPTRNERGNVEMILKTMVHFGKRMELIFVEGNSSDGTFAEIERCMEIYKEEFNIKLYSQDGVGKGDAVRKGFSEATGDILIILDADLTVRPQELPKFYDALCSFSGEFINGSRLVYSMENQSMRFLNLLGNKVFSWVFSFILDQRFKDTLCGTKVLFRNDYRLIAANRSFFGDFDPFGDFDLIFGAAKLNLKILEMPVHYHARQYGDTNISRFRHGLILLRMSLFALGKFKLLH